MNSNWNNYSKAFYTLLAAIASCCAFSNSNVVFYIQNNVKIVSIDSIYVTPHSVPQEGVIYVSEKAVFHNSTILSASVVYVSAPEKKEKRIVQSAFDKNVHKNAPVTILTTVSRLHFEPFPNKGKHPDFFSAEASLIVTTIKKHSKKITAFSQKIASYSVLSGVLKAVRKNNTIYSRCFLQHSSFSKFTHFGRPPPVVALVYCTIGC